MLPGDLLCKFMKERLEENLEFFKDLVKRDLDRQPEKVNLQVGHPACMCLTPSPACLRPQALLVFDPKPCPSAIANPACTAQWRCTSHAKRVSGMLN